MSQEKKKKNNHNFYIFIALTVIVVIIIYFAYTRSQIPIEPNKVYITELKDMVVSNQGELHVRMSVDIESPDEESLKSLSEDEWEIRDNIMSIVEGMSDSDVSDPNVTDSLKKQIKDYLDENYPGSEVVGVYFSDYITQ